MELRTSLLKQEEKSDCGIVALAIILEYYSVRDSIKEIKKIMNYKEGYTYMPQLGLYLLDRGFDVTITTLHPRLFTKNDINLTKDELIKRFNDFIPRSEQEKRIANYFIDFLNRGGNIEIKIPSLKDIIVDINKKRPLIALLTTNFLDSPKPSLNSHFNIVTGYDKDYVYVNDPAVYRGGRKRYLIKDFFFGLYANVGGGIDNSSFMKIKPRTKLTS